MAKIMDNISKQAAQLMINKKSGFISDNTEVKFYKNYQRSFLTVNDFIIATIDHKAVNDNPVLRMKNTGNKNNTVKNRLNAILYFLTDSKIKQKNDNWFLIDETNSTIKPFVSDDWNNIF